MTLTSICAPSTFALLLLPAIGAAGCVALEGDLGQYSASGATSGDAGTTDDSTDGASTGEPAAGSCSPRDPDVAVDLKVDAPTLITSDPFDGEFEVDCAVAAASATAIALDCVDAEQVAHAVTLTLATPSPLTGVLGGETEVRLRYRHFDSQEFGLDIRKHVSLRALDDDALLLFYGRGLEVFDPALADHWAPLQIAHGEGACPVEPDGLCVTEERVPLDVGVGGAQSVVFDGGAVGFAPESLRIYVEYAVEVVQVAFTGCFDIVPGRYSEVLAIVADP